MDILDFDDDIVPLTRGKPNIFGDTFCYFADDQMPLTVIKLMSKDGNTSDVLCLIDSGANGSSFFEKHIRNIQHNIGKPVDINHGIGTTSYNKIFNFGITIQLLCPKTGIRYNYAIPIPVKGPSVTLRQDSMAVETKHGMRWIFGTLGRDIRNQNNISFYHDRAVVILGRELSQAELDKLDHNEQHPFLIGTNEQTG